MNASSETRYPYKNWKYSSHEQILNLIKKSSGVNVLDVGCADGILSKKIQDLGFQVVGIEPNFTDFNLAKAKGLSVINETIPNAVKLIHSKFDIIVLADVLEHLIEPEKDLELVLNYLNPNGYVIIFVFNVAHIYIRIMLLLGNFNYTERGILDKTHVRFFTKKTFFQFLKNFDLVVYDKSITPTPFEIFFKTNNLNILKKCFLYVVYAISRTNFNLFGYQFIARLKKIDKK